MEKYAPSPTWGELGSYLSPACWWTMEASVARWSSLAKVVSPASCWFVADEEFGDCTMVLWLRKLGFYSRLWIYISCWGSEAGQVSATSGSGAENKSTLSSRRFFWFATNRGSIADEGSAKRFCRSRGFCSSSKSYSRWRTCDKEQML